MKLMKFCGACAASAACMLASAPALADGHDECAPTKVTPYWQPGQPGEFGDMLGLLAVTHDGSEVAITSYSTYFLPDADQMHGHIRQISVLDRQTQQGELISVAYNPKPGESISANNHSEWYLDMSPNGRYVAYASRATNLVAQDVSGEHFQVYVRDRQEQVTYLASKSTEGEVANDWGTDVRLGVSNNGKVAFASRGNNLHPEQPITMWAVYVHDVHTGVTELVSRDVDGHPASIDAWGPAISADGNVVAFVSPAPLVPGLTYQSQNVYVRDLAKNTTEIVSVDADGFDRPGAGYFPRLSHDGSRIVFRFDDPSFQAPLDPNFPHGYADVIFVRDRIAGNTIGISKTFDNQPAGVSPEGGFTISGDGAFVAWESNEQITPIKVTGIWHVYRTNVDTFEIDMVTLDAQCNAIPKMHDQMYSAISGDGNHVAFISMWDVLMHGEHDWTHHLYLWTDPNADTTEPSADLNEDGTVDVFDLLILLANWGPCPDDGGCLGDLNTDGTIDVFDLLILLKNWS